MKYIVSRETQAMYAKRYVVTLMPLMHIHIYYMLYVLILWTLFASHFHKGHKMSFMNCLLSTMYTELSTGMFFSIKLNIFFRLVKI
jgi:hypothetical protein